MKPNSSKGMVDRESDRISVERISAKEVVRRVEKITAPTKKKREDLKKHAIDL